MKILIGIAIIILAFCLFVATPTYVNNQCDILRAPVETKLGLPWKKTPCNYKGFMWGSSIIEKINVWITKNQSTNEKFYIIQPESNATN